MKRPHSNILHPNEKQNQNQPSAPPRRKRRIAFREEPNNGGRRPGSVSLVLTEEIRERMWYQPEEYSEMKREVQTLLTDPAAGDSHTTAPGLGRYSRARAHYKQVVLRCLSAAFREIGGDATLLGAVSERCTAHAGRTAAEDAASLFRELYGTPPLALATIPCR